MDKQPDCRWCRGIGSVWLAWSPSGHANDPNEEDIECDCPECEGEGLVSKEKSDDQHEHSEEYMASVYELAWDRFSDEHALHQHSY